MRKRSDAQRAGELRQKIIGFGERSGRKSFYPELRERLAALKESEERFRAVFEGAAIGIAVIDLAGRLQSTNRALQQLLEQPDAALRGRSFLSFVHPEDRARYAEHRDALLRGAGPDDTHEVRLARSDGRVAWAQLTASIAAGDDGSPAYLVVAVQDVTMRRRVEEALQFLSRASVRLASSLDVGETMGNVTDLAVPFLGDLCAIWSPTSEGRVRSLVACCDPEQKALADDLLAGRSIASVLGAEAVGDAPRVFPEASGPLLEAAADDPSRIESLRTLDVRSAIVVPLAAGGTRLGTLLLATARSRRCYGAFDLEVATEYGHRAALALENATLLGETQEASRLKDEFLAIVSHELRTPLTAILGWMGLLRARRLDEAKVEAGMAVVERNARALAQIIDDLLGVSRVMAGKLTIVRAPTDLSAVVESAIESVRLGAAEKRIALHVKCEPGIPPITGDATRLQQVIWNLVSNAVKYTPEGGRVQVRLERAGSTAKLTVSDTGCGIRRDFLAHVFDKFRQEDSSTTRRHGGLGLGLTLVQHLIELHGGAVEAASEGEGRGACFTITLPLAGGGAATGRARPVAELPLVPGMRILVVEDDPDTLELLGEILERQGAQVVLASSVRSALPELDLAAPDLLISDIAMPGQDGIELIQAIRARGLHVPALALSALCREEDRARAMAAGFDRYLVKPVDLSELLQAVAAWGVGARVPPPAHPEV